MSIVKVCDAIMGSGKTSAAINLMNSEPNRKFIYITPFLDEVKRIRESCPILNFKEPVMTNGRTKSEDFLTLLESRCNIASTHALFKKSGADVAKLIKKGGYTLILDEVCDVVETLEVPPSDYHLLLDSGIISITDDGRVRWNREDYEKDGHFYPLMKAIIDGDVIAEDERLMIWRFSYSIFEAFEEVLILTYMFDAQIQKYYFDINKIEYQYVGVSKTSGRYCFCEADGTCRRAPFNLKELVHILDDAKLNECGKDPNAFSVSWYNRQLKNGGLDRIKLNAENVVRHKWGVKSDQVLWATFKDSKAKLRGKGYTRSYLSFNARATNDYRNRTHLMYLVNVFPQVDLTTFFAKHGITIDRDRYATSVMVQWIWRSAIRDGKEIWVYIPSSRMRNLLEQWLEEVSPLVAST